MSGWTEIEKGSVKLKHHSTPSLIEVTITKELEVDWGKVEKTEQTFWLDYIGFSDLREAINSTDFP